MRLYKLWRHLSEWDEARPGHKSVLFTSRHYSRGRTSNNYPFCLLLQQVLATRRNNKEQICAWATVSSRHVLSQRSKTQILSMFLMLTRRGDVTRRHSDATNNPVHLSCTQTFYLHICVGEWHNRPLMQCWLESLLFYYCRVLTRIQQVTPQHQQVFHKVKCWMNSAILLQ